MISPALSSFILPEIRKIRTSTCLFDMHRHPCIPLRRMQSFRINIALSRAKRLFPHISNALDVLIEFAGGWGALRR
ncbi:hypothetical protein C8R44DRAFT_806849 [Mycena epipterygia]|nr:hypothetical protein C8R44DRAFT_806849 [Mycena epipterygia]